MFNLRRCLALALPIPAVLSAQITIHLSASTRQAFDKYVTVAETKMAGDVRTAAKADGNIDLAAVDGSPVDVPDGMIHDWVGGVLVRGASVEKALRMFSIGLSPIELLHSLAGGSARGGSAINFGER